MYIGMYDTILTKMQTFFKNSIMVLLLFGNRVKWTARKHRTMQWNCSRRTWSYTSINGKNRNPFQSHQVIHKISCSNLWQRLVSTNKGDNTFSYYGIRLRFLIDFFVPFPLQDLVPPKELLTKVIKELLTTSQPHCEVIAKVLFEVNTNTNQIVQTKYSKFTKIYIDYADFSIGHRFVVFSIATRLVAVLIAKLFGISSTQNNVVHYRHIYIGLNQFGFNKDFSAIDCWKDEGKWNTTCTTTNRAWFIVYIGL